LFKPDVAGSDLLEALLLLLNGVKQQQIYPELLECCNTSSIFTGKGKRNSLENYRGVFRVTIFRYILDRFIYNDEYPNIDAGLTDSNVGAKNNRNIRDNIFVLSAVMIEVINGNAKPIDLQIYDVAKCFDLMLFG
jgi:hypothetical protein